MYYLFSYIIIWVPFSIVISYLLHRYTGTQVCNDPARKIITILLTNRCYKNDTRESKLKIAAARRNFNNAVKLVVDGH